MRVLNNILKGRMGFQGMQEFSDFSVFVIYMYVSSFYSLLFSSITTLRRV